MEVGEADGEGPSGLIVQGEGQIEGHAVLDEPQGLLDLRGR